jgi:undecaprenyl diphosphate synthase
MARSTKPAAAAPGSSESGSVPGYIAIVMDGNGRWAKKRGRPRSLGHQAGLKALRRIVEHCGRCGVAELTVFAFSSENWNRPKTEVSRLMDLFMRALEKETRELHENGVRLRFIGELSAFAPAIQQSIQNAVSTTGGNQRMKLNVAVNYGGRWDITQAARKLAQACEDGRMHARDIDEAALAGHLMLADSPPPDLFIRTGGEMRISNFLLWQSAYTEFYFSPVLWPDFSPECLDAAIADFASRERRFGLVSEQIQRQAG